VHACETATSRETAGVLGDLSTYLGKGKASTGIHNHVVADADSLRRPVAAIVTLFAVGGPMQTTVTSLTLRVASITGIEKGFYMTNHRNE